MSRTENEADAGREMPAVGGPTPFWDAFCMGIDVDLNGVPVADREDLRSAEQWPWVSQASRGSGDAG